MRPEDGGHAPQGIVLPLQGSVTTLSADFRRYWSETRLPARLPLLLRGPALRQQAKGLPFGLLALRQQAEGDSSGLLALRQQAEGDSLGLLAQRQQAKGATKLPGARLRGVFSA